MRIALLGTRGIPANYGGFETFAEELSTRLVARGHSVTVWCRERHTAPSYKGVNLRYIPPLRHKYLETVAHTFVCSLDLLRRRHDVALFCNGANALFTALPRLARTPVVLNVDGLERKRKKWNALGRGWYLLSEWLSTFLPDIVVSDAQNIANYYQQRYGKSTVFIPYGAETGKVQSTRILSELGLQPGRYFLYVSRMEPENNALLVRQAFERLDTDMKLALIGDSPYARDYIRQVRDTNDPRIVMPGAIYGAGYHELQSHCFAYIQATEVGGTHPALIEAMGRGALTLFLNTPENSEVAEGAAIAFEHGNLTECMSRVLDMTDDQRQSLSCAALRRVREGYSWDAVTTAYEELFESLLRERLR